MTMTLAPPPEPETIAPVPESETIAPSCEPEPYAAPPEQPPYRPPRRGGVVAGIILLALGLVLLLGNVLPTPGGLLFLGLGSAFLIARVVTGRYGYAVPAGMLFGFGAFVALSETGLLAGRDTGGLFFIMLGLGFLAVYLIGATASFAWPLIPAAALIGFGLFLQGYALGWSVMPFVWLAAYWPFTLILVGVWLLVRDHLPPAWRSTAAIVGVSALILVGFLVAAGGVASIAAPTAGFVPFRAWSGVQTMPVLGLPQAQDTIVLTAPIGPGDILRVTNTSGRTTVRPANDGQVRVQAIRHYSSTTEPPDVRLVPGANTLTVESNQPVFGPGMMSSVDYVIDVPSSAGVDVGSASGDVTVNGLQGPVALRTISGSIVANDLGGDTSLSTTSGAMRGTNLDRVRQARSVSGDMDLGGAFGTDSTVATTSGGVTLRFEPGASVRIDATTLSGDVTARGAGLSTTASIGQSRTFVLGSGTMHIGVRTTSGDIRLVAQ